MEYQWYRDSKLDLHRMLRKAEQTKFVVFECIATKKQICCLFSFSDVHESVRREIEQDGTHSVVYIGLWSQSGGQGFVICHRCCENIDQQETISLDINQSLLAIAYPS